VCSHKGNRFQVTTLTSFFSHFHPSLTTQMHTPLATNTISSRVELMAAIATVDELVVRAVRLTRTAQILKNTAKDVARTAQDLQGGFIFLILLPYSFSHRAPC
jgi:hypothetical protein